ncbi:hypothetical protein [Desertivibrio insolitus]|uniref:hypothetical protein n=1 Tax=Herbiconiux sp. SYSU D00978 TaxID=2812562 RepID=UPI001A966D49|nr:hypothetical protein [Herbiconiux sp. SYSU D00978]
MIARIMPVAVIAVAALTLTGCSLPRVDVEAWEAAQAPVDQEAPPESEAPLEQPPVEEELVENVPIELGAPAEFYGSGGALLARFSLTEIVVDPVCTAADAGLPANGHFVALRVDVETFPELGSDDVPLISFDPFFWQAYDDAGEPALEVIGHGALCMDESELLPLAIGPSERLTGLVVLDVAAESGSVVYNPFSSGGGWEWLYGASAPA